MMRAVMRADASERVGLGHLRRSQCLAAALAARGLEVELWLHGDVGRSGSAHSVFPTTRYVAQRELPESCDVLVIDSYSLTHDQVAEARRGTALVVALEDLQDRALPADIVHCASPGAEAWVRSAVPDALMLTGPAYALLRPEFADDPRRAWRDAVGSVLITVGGADQGRWADALIEQVRAIVPSATCDVVVGPLAMGISDHPAGGVRTHTSPPNMRELMLRADLAISGAGQTLFELAATATPTIAMAIAQNQIRHVSGLQNAGAVRWAASWSDPDWRERIASAIAASDASVRRRLGERGRDLVDGRGAARTADAIVARLEAR